MNAATKLAAQAPPGCHAAQKKLLQANMVTGATEKMDVKAWRPSSPPPGTTEPPKESASDIPAAANDFVEKPDHRVAYLMWLMIKSSFRGVRRSIMPTPMP